MHSTILCLTYLISIFSYLEFDPVKWMRDKITWSMHQNINFKSSFISPCWYLYLNETKDLVERIYDTKRRDEIITSELSKWYSFNRNESKWKLIENKKEELIKRLSKTSEDNISIIRIKACLKIKIP